ncbi:MAG: DegT/DnrJ/EryC1/StrS aminotransferase family protein [Treponema sp.]|jgi:dTDP-4-amino-4,6-dideoxygalactose transaminase|nr:DegT/DnrJ/EryC1/StrS aminotransferase family protein [Treponema sp.]
MDHKNIPFGRPFIGKEEEAACVRVLRSGWLTTGGETLAFENEFAVFLTSGTLRDTAEFLHSANSEPLEPPDRCADGAAVRCLAVNSATSGLHLALEACGVGKGDLVLTPSYTFASTAEVVRYLGAEPVFVDTAPGSFHLDPNALEAVIQRLSAGEYAYPARGGFGPRGTPKAVLPVHYGGLPCDMNAIKAIAARRDLKVIEDAAHSFPSAMEAGFAGTVGDVGVFSFYATKPLATGEGGMVVTRRRELADRISIMRSHGIDRTIWNRYTDTRASWRYEVVAPGYKYNLPDVLAALGRVQLSRCMELLSMRKRLAAQYDAAFSGDERFIIPATGESDARHLYPLRLRQPIDRDGFIQTMRDLGVGVSVHFIPLHTMPYYRDRYGFEDSDLPESLKMFKREVSLPLWPGMTEEDAASVIACVRRACSQPFIGRRLSVR